MGCDEKQPLERITVQWGDCTVRITVVTVEGKAELDAMRSDGRLLFEGDRWMLRLPRDQTLAALLDGIAGVIRCRRAPV
jgi:hypothetical protein